MLFMQFLGWIVLISLYIFFLLLLELTVSFASLDVSKKH